MQIEGTKLIFIMNFGVLDFFKFAPRMPQIAQILVSTFNIFRGSMPLDPTEISCFFLQQLQAVTRKLLCVSGCGAEKRGELFLPRRLRLPQWW